MVVGSLSIFTDGALWYNTACKWFRLKKHEVYGIKMKNLMERFIQQYLKDRTTECFDDHFPCTKKKEKCDRQHMYGIG
jgi:hypothetical protein